jgi:hypothetical protein
MARRHLNPDQAREAWEVEVDRLMQRADVELGQELRDELVRDLAEQEPRGPAPRTSARRLAVVRAAGEIKAEERRLRSEMNKERWRERNRSGGEPCPPSSGRAENHPHPGEPG